MKEGGERTPEKPQDPRIKAGVERVLDAIEAGSGHGEVFEEVRDTIPPEMDQDFLEVLRREGKRRGLDIDWKHAEEPASASEDKSETQLDIESIRADVQRRIDQLNIDDEHRASLTKRLADGRIMRVRSISKDVARLEDLAKKKHERAARKAATSPTPITPKRSKAERKEKKTDKRIDPISEAMKAAHAEPDGPVPTPGDEAEKLQRKAQKEMRADFKSRIHALKGNDLMQRKEFFFDLLAKAESAEELSRFGSYLSDVENGRPSNPDAKGMTFGSPHKEAPLHVKETLGVHTVSENGITRLATQEEIRAFGRKPEHGPIKPGPMTDQNREDLYDMTGNAESKLLNGLDGLQKRALHRISPTGPKIKQKTPYPGGQTVPPTVFRGKLSRGVRDPSVGPSESIHHEKISNLDEILSNPRRQVMFGEFLQAQGNDGLIEKYHEGQKNPSAWPISQNLILQNMLRAFDKRFAAVEAIKAGLTKGDAETFIRENTQLGFMETGTNSDRAFQILRDSLDHTLMIMPENEYAGVVDAMQKTNAIRNDHRFKAIAERARKAVKDEGVNPEDLKWETIEKNPYLLNAIRRPKLTDWVFGDESPKNSQEMLDAIKFNRAVAGTLLASTIANDPLLKQRLLREVHTHDRAPETAAQGIAAYEGVLAENERVAALDALKPEVWSEKLKDASFKNTIMPKGNWGTSTEAERASAFSNHLQASGGDIHIRRGWLARIVSSVFSTGVRKTVESLTAQGAFK